jgi:single-strand DNA-binding protein
MTTLKNSVQLIGHAGIDPEVKTIGKDRKMARFTLATNDYYINEKGDRKEDTQWHRLVAWGKTAEIVEKHVKKGQQVAISGKLTNNNWEDKDGNKHQHVEVVINEIIAFQNNNTPNEQ